MQTHFCAIATYLPYNLMLDR